MAARHVFTLDEAIEMVQQEGLDIENDVDFVESDEGSIPPDPREVEFVCDDELGSESGDDDGDGAPSEHSDEEEMQATEEDSEHGEEEMFADDEEPDFTVDWGRDICSFPLGAVFTGTPGMYHLATF